MSKVTLTNLANLQNENTAVTTINANSAALTAAIDNTLSRDGTTPNSMGASLDMNGNRIINIGAPVNMNDVPRLQDVVSNPTVVLGANIINGVSYPAGPALYTEPTVTSSNTVTYRKQKVTPQMFSAVGDGTTDDTTAIQNWLDYTGGDRYLPKGNYLISAGLTWTKGGSIEGDGIGSVILVKSTVSVATDVLTITPDSGVNNAWSLKNLTFTSQSGTPARHVININLPTSTQYMSGSIFSGLTFAGSFINGDAIHLTSVLTDGFFTSIIEKCVFGCGAGINLQNCGDSIYIRNCVISGYGNVHPYTGIYVTMVTGALGPFIYDNNITTIGTGGVSGIFLFGALQAEIIGNEVEWNVTNGLALPLVVLSNCRGTRIYRNTLGGLTGATACVYLLGTTTQSEISGNFMSIANGTGSHISFANNVVGNWIDKNNTYLDTTTTYVDNALYAGLNSTTNPNYGVFASNLTLSNSWVDGSNASHRSGLWVTRLKDGDVILSGNIKNGTTTAGTTICTLPVGCRPTTAVTLPVLVYNGSAWSVGVIVIASSGVLTIGSVAFAGSNIVQFDHVRFTTL